MRKKDDKKKGNGNTRNKDDNKKGNGNTRNKDDNKKDKKRNNYDNEEDRPSSATTPDAPWAWGAHAPWAWGAHAPWAWGASAPPRLHAPQLIGRLLSDASTSSAMVLPVSACACGRPGA